MIGEMIIANYLKDIDLAQIERDNVAQEQVSINAIATLLNFIIFFVR